MESLGESNDNIPADELRFAARQARIGLRNQKFAAMTPARKRVTIARDVLKWLKMGKLQPAGGETGGSHYLSIFAVQPDGSHAVLSPTQEREEGVNGYSCTACAVGGLLAAASYREACRLFTPEDGNLSGGGSGTGDTHQAVTIGKELERSGLFTAEQTTLIEQAYERGIGIPNPSYNNVGLGYFIAEHQVKAARAFGCNYPTRVERMEAIMRNIITNRGTFVP